MLLHLGAKNGADLDGAIPIGHHERRGCLELSMTPEFQHFSPLTHRWILTYGFILSRCTSHVVRALTCQRNSHLRTLDTEVVSCIKLSPQQSDQPVTKTKTKANEASTNKQTSLVSQAG